MDRLFRSRMMKTIIVFQIIFFVVQIFVFYPCLVSAPKEALLHSEHIDKRTVDRYLQQQHQDADDHGLVDKMQQDDGDKEENKELNMIDQKDVMLNENAKSKEKVAKIKENRMTNKDTKYEPVWESLESRPIPNWYDDAKIGIFLHWGVYSVPSYVGVGTKGLSEWFWYNWMGGDTSKRRHPAAESVRDYVKRTYPPNFKYTDFASSFTAEFFDPDHWASIFQASGAKYLVLTSKHHEGYPLWGSKKSWNWNSVDIGPHRDLVGDLSKAVRSQTDLRFGVYHSLYEWFNPTYLEDKKNDFKTQNYIKEKLMPELHEVVELYKPEVVWSDGDWDAPSSYWNSTQFLAWLYNESPVKDTVVTNDRWGKEATCKHGGYFTCRDRYNPGETQSRKWENCMTIDRESWGYRRNARAEDYYDMDGLTEILAQTVSYGGNLLMNVGPTADGRIAPIFEERLRQFGSWLKVNGEGIYETRVWTHQVDGLNKNVYYTKKQTGSDTAVYAIVLEWPKGDQLELSAPQMSQNTGVTWLGYPEPIQWHHRDGGVVLKLPKVSMGEIPCDWAWVFKFTQLKNAV